jgi:hypothetical protein
MSKNKTPKSKYIKFVGKRKERKRKQRNDNIFTSSFFPTDKWGHLMVYEYYFSPSYKRKVYGVNWNIHRLKKEAVEEDFTSLHPSIIFDTWEDAVKFFNDYKKNIIGDLEKSF